MSYIDRIRTIETIRGQQCTACKVYDNGNGCKDCIVQNIVNTLWDMPEKKAEPVPEDRWVENDCPRCGARMGT